MKCRSVTAVPTVADTEMSLRPSVCLAERFCDMMEFHTPGMHCQQIPQHRPWTACNTFTLQYRHRYYMWARLNVGRSQTCDKTVFVSCLIAVAIVTSSAKIHSFAESRPPISQWQVPIHGTTPQTLSHTVLKWNRYILATYGCTGWYTAQLQRQTLCVYLRLVCSVLNENSIIDY